MIDKMLSVIAPHDCLSCGTEGTLLCSPCLSLLPCLAERCYKCHKYSKDSLTCKACKRKTKLNRLRAVTYHDNVAKELVWKLKFENAKHASMAVAQALEPLFGQRGQDIIIVHVPTATSRARQRGYDQAQLIAKNVATKAGAPYVNALRRMGQHQQLGSTRQRRLSQMRDSFRVVDETILQESHVLLVDDVVTTGATIEAAAAVIKNSGAKSVEAIVFAQA